MIQAIITITKYDKNWNINKIKSIFISKIQSWHQMWILYACNHGTTNTNNWNISTIHIYIIAIIQMLLGQQLLEIYDRCIFIIYIYIQCTRPINRSIIMNTRRNQTPNIVLCTNFIVISTKKYKNFVTNQISGHI